LFPGDEVGFTLSGGLSIFNEAFDEFDIEDGFSPLILLVEGTCLLGHTKHFFEPVIMALCDFENGGPFQFIRAGYRYQANGGFLFRGGLLFVYFGDGFSVLPTLSLGYSF
jgi:hypothetical protein